MSTAIAKDILEYHFLSKHRPEKYADSLPFLDWDNQPNPFGEYLGTPKTELPFLAQPLGLGAEFLYRPITGAPRPVDLESVGAFLELSLALSAWKSYGEESWALRINPSSGNLHPTEAHLILPQLSGVFHYQPLHHQLERRAALGAATVPLSAILGQGFWVGLSSLVIRESWKYGVRAFRYCQHDLGHALGALGFAANLLGWKVKLVNGLGTEELGQMLGFAQVKWNPGEEEEPEALVWVGPGEPLTEVPAEALELLAGLDWAGTPAKLCEENLPWQPNDEAALYSRQAHRPYAPVLLPERPWSRPRPQTYDAEGLIRRRRSGQAYQAAASVMDQDRFFALLEATLPRRGQAPFDLGLPCPAVHLVLFVHRVTGLTPGVYLYCREPEALDRLKGSLAPRFLWSAFGDSGLFLLEPGDARQMIGQACCNQAIAANSTFSLGMLAPFGGVGADASLYRRLFWACGLVGQVLYLEAEAAGFRGTGIGCYHDDQIHDFLGIQDQEFQSLYHFTLGGAIEDQRLTHQPPYDSKRNR